MSVKYSKLLCQAPALDKTHRQEFLLRQLIAGYDLNYRIGDLAAGVRQRGQCGSEPVGEFFIVKTDYRNIFRYPDIVSG